MNYNSTISRYIEEGNFAHRRLTTPKFSEVISELHFRFRYRSTKSSIEMFEW